MTKYSFIFISLFTIIIQSAHANEAFIEWRKTSPNQFQLDNGINVIHQQRKHHQRAGIALIVDIGLGDFSCKNQAAPHLLEHLFFEGTQQFSANQLRQRIRQKSGKSNGFTFSEETVYTIHIHKDYLGFALDHLYHTLTDSLFNESAYQRAVSAVESERGIPNHFLQQEFDNERSVEEQTISRAYRETAIECYEKSIPSRISLNTLKQIREQYYQAQNMSLVIISNHSKAELIQLVNDNFAQYSLKNNIDTHSKPVNQDYLQPISATVPSKAITKYTDPTNVEADLYMVIPTIGHSHDMAYAVEIISQYLDEELFKVVRNELGLGYTPWARYRSGTHYGYIIAHVRTTSSRIDKAQQAFIDVYQHMLSEGIPKERLKQLITTEKLKIQSDERSTQFWLQQIRKQRLKGQWLSDEDQLNRITSNTINSVLATYLAKHPTFGLYRPRPVKNTAFHIILILLGSAAAAGVIIYVKKRLLRR